MGIIIQSLKVIPTVAMATSEVRGNDHLRVVSHVVETTMPINVLIKVSPTRKHNLLYLLNRSSFNGQYMQP